MKKVILMIMFFVSANVALAQSPITGTVNGEDGKPLYGVTVKVKGTLKAVITDLDGKYSIQAESTDVLEFTFIGLTKQEVKINGREIIDINMGEDVEMLGDVVVTGFQTISKERATGSFSVVNEKILEKRPVSDISSALKGLAPGLAGDNFENFKIRGQGSLTGGSKPLIVVDGFPIDGDFSTINPNDIANINILKDASATSIYGARAANGVIVIITKQVKNEGEIKVSYNGFISVSEKYDLDYAANIMNSKEQIERERRFFDLGYYSALPGNQGFWNQVYSPSQDLFFEHLAGNITEKERDDELNRLSKYSFIDDYSKYLLRNEFKQQHNITISGKTKSNTFRLSGLYINDLTGYTYNNNDKFIFNISNIYKFNNKLSYEFNTNINYNKSNINGDSFNSSLSPYQRLLDDKGNYTNMPNSNSYYTPKRELLEERMPYKNWRYNILEEANNRNNTSESLAIRIQNKLNYKILNGLNLSAQFQYEKRNNESKSILSEKTFFIRNRVNRFSSNDNGKGGTQYEYKENGFDKGGSLVTVSSNREAYNFRTQLDFNKEIFPDHRVVGLMGIELISNSQINLPRREILGYDNKTFVGGVFDYTKDVSSFDNSINGRPVSEYTYSRFNETRYFNRFFSGYLNLAYSYKNKYNVNTSIRTDASNYVSKSVKDKFSPFWSLGASWNINKESFIKDNINFIDRLILRATYGVVGLPAARDNLSTLTTLEYGQNSEYVNNLNYAGINSYGLNSLDWEKSYTTNIGIDYAIFKNKILR